MLHNFNYNYVVCGAGGFYNIGYRDIMNLPNVNYYESYKQGIQTTWIQRLVRLTFSKKANQYVRTPFSKITYPRIYKPMFEDNKPLCFLFFGNVQYVYQTSYLSYLRDTYPNVKIVLYMQDLICRNPDLNFEGCRNAFDVILSYDKGDAEKYGLHFHPTPMSRVHVEQDARLEKSDVYFCGYAKTRYPLIHELYRKYTDMGLRCDFHIMKFPIGEEKVEGIHYDDEFLTYEQNIQHVLNAKSVLEIMQEGADGFTPRVWESIIYDRHLLTNNESLRHSEYYNPEFMHDVNDSNIVHALKREVTYDTNQKNKLSPIHLLTFIDQLLSC